jgi:hypothetical protein
MRPLVKAALRLDPSFVGDAVGRPLDLWQREVVFTALGGDDCCLRVGRQSGKTEVVAQLAALYLTLPELVNRDRTLVILTSPSQRQSSETHTRILAILDALGAECVERNKLSVRLSNGSRLLALPGSQETLRGISAVDLLLLDEAAYADESLFRAVRPMLSVSRGSGGGRMVLLSTPADPSGFFYQIATANDTDWVRWHIATSQCPRVPDEFLESERRLLGEHIYKREYGAEFVAMDGGLLTWDEARALSCSADTLEAPRLADLINTRRRAISAQDAASGRRAFVPPRLAA